MERQLDFETPFEDRIHAGRVLADRLGPYRAKNVLVLGIPRGGVPVAAEVARRLDADLDVIVARKHHPARLVVAVPVGSRQACDALRSEADEGVCPNIPEDFGAVGYFCRNFDPTEDAEVVEILAGFRRSRAAVPAAGETRAAARSWPT